MGNGIKLKHSWAAWLFLVMLTAISTAGLSDLFYGPKAFVIQEKETSSVNKTQESTKEESTGVQPEGGSANKTLYSVLSVTDGDTIRIDYQGESTPLRIIGIDTPETVDSRTTVQCFGQEASDYLKTKLTGKKVSIEADSTQSDRDKYDRLLRYVYLDGQDVGLDIIANGYGHEYTYNVPYQKQSEYKSAEKKAEQNNLGLWAPTACAGTESSKSTSDSTAQQTPTTSTVVPEQSAECTIKGNISNEGEKIYHLPGQRYYDATVITPSKGERMFCTEQEAVSAGWRKAKV